MHRPLNPTDPTFGLATIEGSLSAQLNGDGEEEDRPPDVVSRSGEEGRAKVIAGALTKEGLWHNWVTTTSGQWALFWGGGGQMFPGYAPSHISFILTPPLYTPYVCWLDSVEYPPWNYMYVEIGCKQSESNSGPIKQEVWLLHPLPVILTSTVPGYTLVLP